MDQFGVLVESIGFKAQGKSAPLADLKGKTKPSSIKSSRSPYNSNSLNVSFDGDLDGIFRSNNNGKPRNCGGGSWDDYVDVFGGPVEASKPSDGPAGGDGGSMFDLDSVFKGSSNSRARSSVSLLYDDDIFGGMQGMKSSATVNYEDDDGDSMGDLLGNFDGLGLKSNGPRKKYGEVEEKAGESDDLIPGFGESCPPKIVPNLATRQHQQPSGLSANSTSNFAKDPFVVLESSSNSSSSGLPSDLFGKDTGKNSVLSSIDELEDFAMGRVRKNANDQSDVLFGDVKVSLSDSNMKENTNRVRIAREKRSVDAGGSKKVSWEKTGAPAMHDVHKRQEKTGQDKLYHKQREKEERDREQRQIFENENELESFFSKSHPNSATGPSPTTVDRIFDILFQNEGPKVKQTSSGAGTSTGIKKSSSVTNNFDDFPFMFGAAPSSGEFQEIEGESKERRKARLNHHLRTQARMAEALAEKNQRDFQIQQEQEEKHRLAEILDDDIKRWAAGKEGNLRALLSSLQHVLWPECGWQPIPLTDLITSVSVKKVYHKATLCVHPDKVQQKGASVQQKYIAEKVFDVLKEAWNKFNSEELR